ncbi:MAG TPA: amidohydrolase family protein [Vineibacter sp.]|nr:amidohydrolase family protein [Vineibacter sp.]
MHDLVIRGGTIVDGSGAAPVEGDVAIDGGTITSVSGKVGNGREEIDARGQVVAPGWVDIHTHYDGQVTWDPYLTPSGWHGVTTAVMGNCGVGFAPARPDRHDWLIGLMEGVEDIPGTALAEGIRWEWETFPEYLDALQKMPRAMDIATQVPHGAVRAYVMGDRGADNEVATDDDIRQMAAIVAQGIRAGALGFSTSRTRLHRAVDGREVPGTFANATEMVALGRAVKRGGYGVVEIASDMTPKQDEFAWMTALSRETGLPITYALVQNAAHPGKWRALLDQTAQARASGANITAQVACRPVGVLLGLQSRVQPFTTCPSYMAIADKPLEERVRLMRDPALKARILAESAQNTKREWFRPAGQFDNIFALGDPPNYEPTPEQSIAHVAAALGRDPNEYLYDLLLQRDGRELLYFPTLNYADRNFDALDTMLRHPDTVLSLSDGGAHCGVICDASAPTFLLTHWVKGRTRGPRLSLEQAVRLQTRRTAEVYGLLDRGLLRSGLKADVNVIDLDNLRLEPPVMAYDLPAEGRRLLQRGSGYRATIVAGAVTWRDGEATGALPGQLIRGPQAPR